MKSQISPMRRLALGLLVCATALGLASESRAQDTTLADLVAGGMLISLSGELLFSDFSATPAGDVDSDLADYAVEALADGFRVLPASGGLSVAAGEAGALAIDYRVTSGAGIQISETLLSFDAVATGAGSFARSSQDYFSNATETDMLGDAVVLVTGGGGSMAMSGFVLADAVDGLAVLAALQVEAPGQGSASINFVDQEFVTVPEPGSALLALTALLSLAGLRRIRS